MSKKKHSRKKTVLYYTKGFRGSKGISFKSSNQAYIKALCNLYKNRKTKKRFYNKLWILRLNTKLYLFSNWSNFHNLLKKNNILLNKKMCCFLAIQDHYSFLTLFKKIL